MINALKYVNGIILFFVLIAGCIREDPQAQNRSAVKDMTTQEIIAQRTTVAGTTPEKFSLTSPVFKHGDLIPSKYTCDGEDISPQLSWGKAPDGTKTIALVVDDPDARGIFTHWVLFNLPANKTGLPEGVPKIDRLDGGGIQGKNDFGRIGYGGPCPPKRHTYRFILYALDIELNLKPGATRQQVLKAMEGHVISKTELDGKYGR